MKKTVVLVAASVLAVVAGLGSLVVTVGVHYIVRMDQAWFVSRFGPGGDAAYRNYDMLYEHALVVAGAASKYMAAFYASVAIGFLAFGAICALWARDVRRGSQEKIRKAVDQA
jgi:hypothetical protein